MRFLPAPALLLSVTLWCSHAAMAQSLRPTPRTAAGLMPAETQAPQQADYIVAVVNSEPITNHEVAQEVRRTLAQLAQQRRTAPPVEVLTRQVLDRLVDERAQLQLARETGIRIEDASVDQAEQAVAQQNQLDVATLRQRLKQDGIDLKKFRDGLRDQLMLTRLRQREVEPRVQVSDLEVDQYLHEQAAQQSPEHQLINVAQILVAVPETATEAEVATLRARAEAILQRARAGEDFAALARAMSDASDRVNGGQLGLRPAERYPTLFVDATAQLAPGGLSAIVRSGAGFHILKLLERQSPGLPAMTVTQSHARHILLRPNAQFDEAQTRARLLDFKKRIESGRADFATLAREYSQDGSAAAGGDLGWASPGMFVPEFESVMDKLAPGQISDPLISRFGVHLIQLLERRQAKLSPREQRDMVRAMLREKKLDETYATWAQEVRGRAYVELREPPQ